MFCLYQLESEHGHTLEEICFAPLTSHFTGPAKVSDCTVQSVWGYFQDDEDTFNEESTDDDGYVSNYLDHFSACFQ